MWSSFLVGTKEIGCDFLGSDNLFLSGSIEVNQKVSVITTEPDRLAREWPINDTRLTVLCINVDSNFIRSGPCAAAADDLKVEYPRRVLI
jgi:hypothetical protein